MKIYLGTDHAGFELKKQIKEFLIKTGYDVVDCGNQIFDSQDDYPNFISIVAENVGKDADSYGIVFGKSGTGECIVANKYRGIRAFLAINEKNVRLAREHNDANILSLGARFLSFGEAKDAIKIWLETPFSNEIRHISRIEKIDNI